MKIIMISGKSGSGKNEVASIIRDILPKTVITSFSKYIKLYALEMTRWNGRDLDKPRTFLQEMGDTLRSIDKNFLTKRLLEDLDVYRKYFDNVVISDVRLLNEILYMKENSNEDVITIRVNSNKESIRLNDKEKKHLTENELDNYEGFDYIINNEYNESLVDTVRDIVKGFE